MVAPRLPGLERLPTPKRHGAGLARPTRLSGPSARPAGPRLYSQPGQEIGGPGPAPPGFVTGATSGSEWFIYWALATVYDDPQDPRKPPFWGAASGKWVYQKAALGTYTRQLGSAVVDFVVYTPHDRIGLRIQTSYFHASTGAFAQGLDMLQRVALADVMTVEDLYDQDFITDPTGEAAVIIVKSALGLIERPNVLTSGRSTARG